MGGEIFLTKKEIEMYLKALNLLFIYLKLTNQIDWSWWLVMSPMLAPVVAYWIGIQADKVKAETINVQLKKDGEND